MSSAQAEQPKVCIIIVTWNRADAVVRCLLSLNSLLYSNVETVVVDNNSQDGTVERLRAIFPGLTVLANERNLGFTGGNNAGIRWGMERGADYFFILNNDATVHPATLDELVRVCEADPRIAVAGAKNLVMHHPHIVWGAWGDVTYGRTLTRVHGWRKRDGPKYRQIRDVDQVIGNGCMWRRAAIESVGMLDTDFFGYHEDVEWCYRAKKHGWRVVYVGTSLVYHEGSLSSSPRFENCIPVMYFLGRNAVLFTKKHGNAYRLVQISLNALIGSVARYRRNRTNGSPTGELQFWQGFWDGIRNRNRLTEFRA